MQTHEISCPNCGSGEGVVAPHETRICKYCGTHYLLRPPAPPEVAVPTHGPGAMQRHMFGDIAFAVAVMAALAVGAILLIVWTSGEDEARSKKWPSSNKWPGSYDAPRR
jgi:hypothetical protein